MDYFNNPEFNGKYFCIITKDFIVVSDTLLEAPASYISAYDSAR